MSKKKAKIIGEITLTLFDDGNLNITPNMETPIATFATMAISCLHSAVVAITEDRESRLAELNEMVAIIEKYL